MARGETPFQVDPARLYEVGEDGTPRTDSSAPPPWFSDRHKLVLGLVGLAAMAVGALAAVSVLALAMRWQGMAAGFALATLVASPLLLLGPLQDWWRHRRGHRRAHRSRPENWG